MGSVVRVLGLSCSAARGIVPDQGIEPLHWQADSYPLYLQESPGIFVVLMFCSESIKTENCMFIIVSIIHTHTHTHTQAERGKNEIRMLAIPIFMIQAYEFFLYNFYSKCSTSKLSWVLCSQEKV